MMLQALFGLLVFCGGSSVLTLNIELNECDCINVTECGLVPTGENSTFWSNFEYEDNITVTFSLRISKSLRCPNSESFLVDFTKADNGALVGYTDNSTEAVFMELEKNGNLIFWGSKREEYNPDAFCIKRMNSSHSIIKTCCGRFEKECIRKCCPFGYAFSKNDSNPCVPIVPNGRNFSTQFANGENKLKIRTDLTDCRPSELSTALTKFGIPLTPFRLQPDGTIQFFDSVNFKWKNKLEMGDYCIDTLHLRSDKVDLTCGSEEQDILIICVAEEPYNSTSTSKQLSENDWVNIYRLVYIGGFCISIVFLLVTATVHFLLWEKQNIHAWTILCYVLSLTGFYSCLLINHLEEIRKRLSTNHNVFIPKEVCYAISLIAHFMGVLAFSWLSVINFDLWWTFRVLKPMNRRNFDWKRLMAYASFAIGVPTVVVSVSVGLQLKSEAKLLCRQAKEDSWVYPTYAHETCFLGNASQPFYFYLPVGVLLFSNLIFYLCTSCQMLRIYNATRRLSDRNTRKQKQSCALFFKLFLVMGTTWIFQLILAVAQTDEEVSVWYTALYLVLDLSNIFQAVAIFAIFVCKRETLRALEQKYSCLKRCLHPFGGVYQIQPTTMSRSTDGSTKLSRTELTKTLSIDSYSNGVTGSDRRRDSESEMLRFS